MIWYCLGLSPTSFLKVRLKWDKLIKAGLTAYIFHTHVIYQKLLCFHNTAVDDILIRRIAGNLLEKCAEIKFINVKFFFQKIQGQILIIVTMYKVHYIINNGIMGV